MGKREEVFADIKTSFKNINHSTERYRRTQLLCKIATQPNLKPFPSGLDDFRTNFEMNTYADLYGDGSIEFVAGVSVFAKNLILLKNEYVFKPSQGQLNMRLWSLTLTFSWINSHYRCQKHLILFGHINPILALKIHKMGRIYYHNDAVTLIH